METANKSIEVNEASSGSDCGFYIGTMNHKWNSGVVITVACHIDGWYGLNQEMDTKLMILAKSHGGECYGKGSGYGRRDLEFHFQNFKSAKEFRKKAKKITGDRDHVTSLGIDDLVNIRRNSFLESNMDRDEWLRSTRVF